jgi:hypothetical protein
LTRGDFTLSSTLVGCTRDLSCGSKHFLAGAAINVDKSLVIRAEQIVAML